METTVTKRKGEEARADMTCVPLGTVAKAVSGVGFPRDLQGQTDGEFPVFKVGEISRAWMSGEKYLDESTHNLTHALVKKLKGTPLPAGTTVFAKIGEGLKLNRRMMLARPSLVDNNVMGLIPGEDIDAEYLYHFMTTVDLGALAQATAVPSVRKSDIDEIEVPLPLLPQQRRIVSAIELQLGRLDAAVARLHAAKAKLKRYKQAVLKAAVEGALTEEWREKNAKKLPSAEKVIADLKKARDEAFKKLQKVERGDGERQVRQPKDIEPITEDELASLPGLPEGWAYARVGNAVNDIFDGPFGSHLKSVDYIDAGVRVIRLENIVFLGFRDDLKSYVSEEKYNTIRNHTIGAGDIIFSSFINEQTRVAVLPDQIDLAINKSDCFCVRIDNVPMDRNYVHYFLSSDLAYSQLVHGIHGATRPRINTTQLKQCPIPICGLDEQREIARLVGGALAATEAMETTLDAELLRSTRLRQAVLKRAFEGKLL